MTSQRTIGGIGKALFPHRWGSALVAYVFLIFFIIGVAVHRDYGVSADEPALRKFGIDAFAYLFRDGPIPMQQDWGFFNPVIQVVMRGIELAFGLTDGADIWFMRHFVTFLMFFATIVLFYKIARLRYRDWKLPLLGAVMFMLSPRLFAHGFYNPKDIPAMFFFALCAWTLLRAFDRKTWTTLIVHAVCCALLISVRTFGLLMPILTTLFVAMSVELPIKERLRIVGAYFLTLVTALVFLWPLLWHDPVHGVINAFLNNTSRLGGGFYFGEQISAAGVPWHYLPVWIGITTPVIYSIFFVIGFATLGIRCSRNPLCLLQEKLSSGLALLWFALPVLALLMLPIGIFDEWRHVLFLYPAFLLIALEGLWWTLMIAGKFSRYARLGIYGLLTIQMSFTGFWMLKNHPYEYAYFSIPTQFISGQFELDYWSLSYRAGLEWILRNDKRDHINVHVVAKTGEAAADTLPLEDWNRLYFVEVAQADYIVDNFRSNGYKRGFPEDKKVRAIVIDGLEILAVYRK